MNFGSQDQERQSGPGEIADRAMRFSIVERSLARIYSAVPESVREQTDIAPHEVHREVRPAPIASVIETADQPAATVTSLDEVRRRVQQEAQSAQSINVYPADFRATDEREAA